MQPRSSMSGLLQHGTACNDLSGVPHLSEFSLLTRHPGADLGREGLERRFVVQWQPKWITLQRVPPLGQVLGAERLCKRLQSRITITGEQQS
jgi:hypothetical protein